MYDLDTLIRGRSPPQVGSKNQAPFSLSFVSLFWPPGRPKKSIVANLAPKMTPKWSPKWSRSDERRPSRNMRQRERIACSSPLGSSVFFSETGKRAPKSRHNPSYFEMLGPNDPKSAHRGLPKGAQNVTKIVGEPWAPLGPQGATIALK